MRSKAAKLLLPLSPRSQFCKVFKPRGTLQHPPLFFLNAAVCNEPLEIIERTIADLKRLAAAYPGQAIIIIHDDLLGLRPRAEQAERVALYVREGVAYTVRGPDGRGMSFAKSGNINIGLGFFIELLGHLKTRLRDGLTNNVRDVLEVLVSLQGRGSIFASLEARPHVKSERVALRRARAPSVALGADWASRQGPTCPSIDPKRFRPIHTKVHIPDHVATKLADLDLAGIDRILNMQFDAVSSRRTAQTSHSSRHSWGHTSSSCVPPAGHAHCWGRRLLAPLRARDGA